MRLPLEFSVFEGVEWTLLGTLLGMSSMKGSGVEGQLSSSMAIGTPSQLSQHAAVGSKKFQYMDI